MSSYTVTITPDDDNATSTTLRLDTSGDQILLTDVHLHAGTGLPTGQLPALDYGLLLRAITPGTPTSGSAGPRKRTAATRDRQPRAATTRTGRTRTAAQPAADSQTRRRDAATTEAPTRRAAKKTTGTKAARAAATAGRSYRRMPDDLAAVYRQTGSASATAAHYQVPRHTAYGWIRRLTDQPGT